MSYNEQLQTLWQKFERAHGDDPESLTIRDCFDWAYREKLWRPRPQDMAKMFGREMQEALRQVIRTDPSGRQYRAKHCVRETRGGIQMSLWGDIDTSPRSFMQKSFQQRRKSIVNDSYKLKSDVDHFNEYCSKGNPIQLVLDFTDDVAELEAAKRGYEEDVA